MLTLKNIKIILSQPRKVLSYLRYQIAYILGLHIASSQFGEDLILSYLIRKDKGFYIDIGANDPCLGSNTYYFYTKHWNGITIEPNKQLHKKIKRKRNKGINLNMAVGPKGKLKYYEIDVHGMSTCDSTLASYYVEQGHNIVNTYEVDVMPLSEILDQYASGENIDIMSIDVEGMDMEVLKSNDWNKYRPQYIVLETLVYISDDRPGNKDDKKYTNYLKQFGYEIIADTYVNTIYKLNS